MKTEIEKILKEVERLKGCIYQTVKELGMKEPTEKMVGELDAYEEICGILNDFLCVPELEKDVRETKDLTAAKIAIENSFIKCLWGDKQLAYVFFLGMIYGQTDELPERLIDNEEFVNKNLI